MNTDCNETAPRIGAIARNGRSLLLAALMLVAGIDAAAAQPFPEAKAGPIYSQWSPTKRDIGYLFAGVLDRWSDDGAPPYSVLTVGAQINAMNRAGVNQIAFGIATEAWAEPGSYSMLTGIEATTINREPDNPHRKISMWSTFKNRADTEIWNPPADPMNLNSQALRVESQIGTGFERGITFAEHSLHPSRAMERPAAIDLSEISDAQIGEIDLIRIRADVSLRYDPASRQLYLHNSRALRTSP